MNNQFKEKVVCKKCGHIIYRDLESYNIYTDVLNKEQKNIYAIFVKKFQCPQCKSTEYNSYVIEKDVEAEKSSEIKNTKEIKDKKDMDIINVNLKSKRSSVNKKKIAI